MKDSVSLGTAPFDEDCVQLGDENYYEKAKQECRRFIELLRKKFGYEPEGTILRIKSCPHDFGTYLDVVCEFDEYDEEGRKYAFNIEQEMPDKWE